MDRISKLGVALSLAALIAWQFYTTQQMREARLAQEQSGALSPGRDSAPAAPEGSPPQAAAPAPPPVTLSSAPAPVLPPEPKQARVLKSAEAEWLFTSHGGGIERVTLNKHVGESEKFIALNEFGKIPVGALTEAYETPVLDAFTLEPGTDANAVLFKRMDARQLEITKRFSILPGPDKSKPSESYQLELLLTFANRSSEPLTVPAYALRAGSNAPLHIKDLPIYTGFNRMLGGSTKGADASWFDGGGFLGFGKKPRPIYSESGEVTWVGITNQYYCTIITAAAPASEALASRFTVSADDWRASGRSTEGPMPYAVDGALRLAATGLEPGKEITRKFTIYGGPREFGRLQALKGGQEEMLDFGTFSWVSRILLSSMNGLNALMGSYAAAIVVLTVIIKLLMWPLQNKSTESMKRMQEIQPKMALLREKYANDPQRLNEELLHLYKKHNVNPASGCLPMFLQIPIFFGFYNMLGKAVELRNSPFLWVKDLSQPDTVAHLGGFPVNVLPLLMAVTMLWQMQLTPKTGDPVQQRVFMFMPLIFIVFCYNFASALALYWTVQNIFTIVQLTVTNKRNKADLQKAAAGGKKA